MASFVCFFQGKILLYSWTSNSILVHFTLVHRLFNRPVLCTSRHFLLHRKAQDLLQSAMTLSVMSTQKTISSTMGMGICKLSYSAFPNVKSNGLLRYRGVRSGKAVKTRRQINQSMIPAMITANRPPTINTRSVNAANSIYPSTVESAKTNVPRLSLAVWNARSINRKAAMICDIITSNRLDIFAITETWLNSETNTVAIVEILNILPDFTVFHIPRPNKKGGGIALFVRTSFNITKNLTPTFTSFEHLDITLSYKNFNFRLVVNFRPPPSTKNKLTTAKFFNEFADLTEELTNCHRPLLITGDFNFHLDNNDNGTLIIFSTSWNQRI